MSIYDAMDNGFEWFIEKIAKPIFYLAVIVFVLSIIFVPVLLFINRGEPEVWTLRQDEWNCTSAHTRKQEVCSKGCRWETYQVCDSFERKTK